ncbi:hypothetical protein B5181_35860, partial [Streptomyces sp. 4F]
MTRSEKPPVAVFDLDNTLADTAHRQRYLERRPRDWDAFFAAAPHDQPLAEGIAVGTFQPVPHWVRPAAEAADAFRLLQHSHHVGKLVIAFDETPPLAPYPARHSPDPEGTYLVTGGLGGFGAATARWLAECGA